MTVKQFTAYDPKSRFTVTQAFTRATSRAAGRFLGKVVDALPFPVRAIQVDGGSEFMAEFEKACRAREIVLCVLPPRSPKLNGGVERANGTWRREFRECEDLPDDLPGINAGIDGFAELYNHHRPHGALKGQTPAEYLETIAESGGPESLN